MIKEGFAGDRLLVSRSDGGTVCDTLEQREVQDNFVSEFSTDQIPNSGGCCCILYFLIATTLPPKYLGLIRK